MKIIKLLIKLIFFDKTDISKFTFNKFDAEDITQVLDSVDKFGIAIIKNFASNKNCSDLSNIVERLSLNIQKSGIKINKGEYSHFDMRTANFPIVNIRNKKKEDIDGGMIDIFNPNYLTGLNENKIFEKIIGSFNKEIQDRYLRQFSHFNIYINENVSNTRVSHIDLIDDGIKFMLYLTDVKNKEFGPYSYLPKSHKKKLRLRTVTFLSRVLNRIGLIKNYSFNDFPTFDSSMTNIIGDKGTLIISNQSGIHRGMPQAINRSRIVLVASY